MKPEEKITERFLIELGLSEIVYEPKGQRAPDFSINNEIGVEVRRLNKYVLSNNKTKPIEELQFDLIPKLERLFKSYNDGTHTTSYFIGIAFIRPINVSKSLISQVQSILDNHPSNAVTITEYQVNENLLISIIPSDERFEHQYVFGSSTDFDRGGFVLSDILNSLNIIVPDKQRIVEPHFNDYKKWWLILVDYIGYDLIRESEKETLRKVFRINHLFERIYLISPIDEKRGFLL